MYCPLCKMEYRTGFDKCSDCHTDLVPTREQAESMPVECLWKGTSQSKFNDIAAALQDANVPNMARTGARAEPLPLWATLPVISFFFSMKRAHDQMSWEVFVLQSDYARCRGIVEEG
jgi:hypothetical protein